MNEALITTLETTASALAKAVYELRQQTAPDVPENIKTGPRVLISRLASQCLNLQHKLGIPTIEYRADADSLVNDLIFVGAFIQKLADRQAEPELQKQLAEAKQDAAAKELTLKQIHDMLSTGGFKLAEQAPFIAP